MTNIDYFILIIIFTIIVYLFNTNQFSDNIKNNKDNFNNTEKQLDLSDYINYSVNDFNEKKQHIELMSKTPIIKDLAKYKYGSETKNLSSDMNQFNTQLDKLMDTTLNSSAKLKSNIQNNIKDIKSSENQINTDYVKAFHKIYKIKQEGNTMLNSLFNKFNTNENIDKHEGFSNATSIEIKNEDNLNIFMGTHFILPYQYEKCNNIYMNISDNNPHIRYSSDKIYAMSFQLLDNKFIEFEINIDFKNKSLFDEQLTTENPEHLNNIKGIIITIKRIKPKVKYDYKYLNIINNMKNLLNKLGIKPGNQFMFFLINNKFDTTTKCYLKTTKCEDINNDLYRLYNIDGSTILHLTKKSVIDKPFLSLLK